jgi:KAP family P-loop domain
VYRADVPPPTLTDETDAFGHRDYAAAIASAVSQAEPPFTLGLFGPWGVGKTTILEETERRLPPTCAFAIFDAWRYERDALRRQFLSEVSRQLMEADKLDGYDRPAALEELTTPVSSVRPAGLTVRWENALRAAVTAALVALLVFFGLKLGFTVQKSAIGSAIAAIATLAALLITSIGQVFDIKYETITRPRLEDPERFTEKFEDLLGHLKTERLVVAIDNLDRCTPERVEEVFDTLNTYLEPAGAAQRAQGLSKLLRRKREEGKKKEAVFIVAADDDALRRHLESRERRASAGHLADVGNYTAEYLRKIFKASIPIKPLLDADMRAYVETELARFFAVHPLESAEQRTRLVELVAAALKRNPRRVRQFVNNLELRLELLKARETGSKAIAAALSEDVLTVAKLTLLEEE